MLVEALAAFPTPGAAVDLGCGAGIDTLAMLRQGWSVLAVDAEQEALERVRDLIPPKLAAGLRTQHAPMESIELPAADLVWAGYSLFFCDPGRFPEVWSRVGAAIVPGGRFAGQLLGDRDTWAPHDDITSFTRPRAEELFDGWRVERFDEEENDGEACSGPKHWHVFHVVAVRGE